MDPLYDPIAVQEENYFEVILRTQWEQHSGGERLNISLGELALRPAICSLPTDSLRSVIRLMQENEVGSAIIAKENKVLGIFTERDVLNKVVLSQVDLDSTPVQEFMSRNPDTLGIRDSVSFAINLMTDSHCRHIPVTNKAGRPTHVVSMRDLAAFLADCYPEEVMNLPPQAGQYAASRGGG